MNVIERAEKIIEENNWVTTTQQTTYLNLIDALTHDRFDQSKFYLHATDTQELSISLSSSHTSQIFELLTDSKGNVFLYYLTPTDDFIKQISSKHLNIETIAYYFHHYYQKIFL